MSILKGVRAIHGKKKTILCNNSWTRLCVEHRPIDSGLPWQQCCINIGEKHNISWRDPKVRCTSFCPFPTDQLHRQWLCLNAATSIMCIDTFIEVFSVYVICSLVLLRYITMKTNQDSFYSAKPLHLESVEQTDWNHQQKWNSICLSACSIWIYITNNIIIIIIKQRTY